MTRGRFAAILCLTIAALATARPRVARSAEAVLTGDLIVILEDAIARTGTRKQSGPYSVEIVAGVTDGTFEPESVARVPGTSRMGITALIADARADAALVRLTAKLPLPGAADHEKGGASEFTIELKPTATGWAGTYAGTHAGKKRNGVARASFFSPARAIDGIAPAEPGEHPRLFLRRADIDGLRRAAKTPAGQAIVARLREMLAAPSTDDSALGGRAAGHALLHVLEGDAREALIAGRLVRDAFDRVLNSRDLKRASDWAETAATVRGIAIAYDLCYDGWEPLSRGVIASHLASRARTMVASAGRNAPAIEADPRWWLVARGAGGLAALAVSGDLMARVAEGMEDLTAAALPPATGPRDLPPPSGFVPAKGVPVLPFDNDALPTRWLVAAPFPRDRDTAFTAPGAIAAGEPLPDLGDKGPGRGAPITVQDVTRRWEPLDPRFLIASRQTDGRSTINVTSVLARVPDTAAYFFTVVHNDKPRLVQFRTGKSAAWMAGQRMRDGETLRLSPGFYPVVAAAAIGKLQHSWSQVMITPRLVDVTAIAATQPNMVVPVPTYNPNEPRQDKTVGRIAHAARLWAVRHLAEGYARHLVAAPGEAAAALTDGVLPLALAYRNTMGRDMLAGTSAAGLAEVMDGGDSPFAKLSPDALARLRLAVSAAGGRPGPAGPAAAAINSPTDALLALVSLIERVPPK